MAQSIVRSKENFVCLYCGVMEEDHPNNIVRHFNDEIEVTCLDCDKVYIAEKTADIFYITQKIS